MEETDRSLKFVNYSCNYNPETKYSYWNWTIDGEEWFEELPECKVHCEEDPPEPIFEVLSRKWNEEHWEGSYPVYKCGADLAFDLPEYHYKHKIKMHCDYYNVTGKNHWQFTHLETTHVELPKCVPICPDPPPLEEGIVNITWTEGDWSVGAKASYVCSDPSHMFHDYYVYEEIEFNCTLMPNETQGTWMRQTWNGSLSSTFPKCDVSMILCKKYYKSHISCCYIRLRHLVELFRINMIQPLSTTLNLLLTNTQPL